MKKQIIKNVMFFALLCLLGSAFVINSYADEGTILGDVNKDGSVSVRDALSVLKVAVQLESFDEETAAIADVMSDSQINANDAVLILKKAVGMIWYFPEETVEASGKVYIAGDSIASEHDVDEAYQRPVVGWGSVIDEIFDENVTIINEARSGRSSKSYIRESNYNTYIHQLSKGDYYLISFGHNDEKSSDPSRYTSPMGSSDERESFKWYLKTYYIDPAVEVGAFPVLISPVVRFTFDSNVLNPQSHAAYAVAMEELVEEYKSQGINVGYIDLHQLTSDYYNEVGAEEAETLHAYTVTELDRTHYCEKGARLISEIIVGEMNRQNFDICKYFRIIQ